MWFERFKINCFSIYLKSAVILLSIFPEIRGEYHPLEEIRDDYGLEENRDLDDMAINDSSPPSDTISVHTFEILPSDMNEDIQSRCSLQSDHTKMMDCKIDRLVESKEQILYIVNSLNEKIDHILGTVNTQKERSPPDFDLVNTLQIMNKLEEIQRCVHCTNVGNKADRVRHY